MSNVPKGGTPIKADMLFNKNIFRLSGSAAWYTATSEPSIQGVPGKEKVIISAVTRTGTHKTIRVPFGSLVYIK